MSIPGQPGFDHVVPKTQADNRPQVQESLDRIGINHLIRQFPDVVEETILKSQYYNRSRRAELRTLFTGLFLDRAVSASGTIDRLIVGNYTSPEDINQRPISKFMADSARDVGLLPKE